MSKGRKIIRLKWLHTSDVHANLFGCEYRNGMRYVGGGLYDVYSYIYDLKKEYKDRLIITDGGDCLKGQPLAYYYNFIDTKSPHLVAEVMNEIGYECGVMGNHDIEVGEKTFERWMHDCNFPILGANVIDKRTGKPYLKPYVVVERSGVKIVILGLVTSAVPYYQPESLMPHLQFDEMLPCAKRWVERIQEEEHPDLLVGLFHSGFEGGHIADGEDAVKEIAEKVSGFDLICFGHDHAPIAHVVKNVDDKDVVCMSAASTDGFFAEADIDISIEKGHHVSKSIKARINNINTQNVHGNYLQIKYSEQIKRVKSWGNEPLCTLLETLDEGDAYLGASPFVDFIHHYQFDMTHAEISLAAPYSFNTRLNKGKLLRKDLYPLLAYEDFVFTLRLTGQKLKEILELSYGELVHPLNEKSKHIFRIYNFSAASSEFKRLKRICKQILYRGREPYIWRFESSVSQMFSAAGIRYDVDVTKPIGSRINILSMTDGTPFSKDKEYRVAVIRRLLCDREGVLYRAGLSVEDVHQRIVNMSEMSLPYYMMNKMQEQKNISVNRMSQWRFVPEEIVAPLLIRDRKLLFPSNMILEIFNSFRK